ncbi:class I SAM-dependent methyltransferase [Bacillus pfraonensis]|uniref:class I SAM-dependent methyltransferase n=1 Tax=Bacillus TaxID=1386 RepID=UPI002A58C6E1|nr:class I SAM-dependent methyltransferase [Bacillus pseudomycoides]
MNVLERLIEQAKNPRGCVGSFMLNIMNTAHATMTEWALGKVKIKEDAVMLDIGCGGGKTIHTLSSMNKNGKLYGIDYSEQAVEDSIRVNKDDVETGKVNIRQANVSNIPFPEESFDIITAFQTHYFWPDLENDVKEIFRVLKHHGHFMIVAELYKINYHMKAYKTKKEMEQLFKKAGFNTVQFHESTNKKWLCIVGGK